MDQVEISVVTLDNGQKYEIIDKIKIDDAIYFFLVNTNNAEDRCIRKQIFKNDQEIFQTLKKEEFQNVIKMFVKKYGGDNER